MRDQQRYRYLLAAAAIVVGIYILADSRRSHSPSDPVLHSEARRKTSNDSGAECTPVCCGTGWQAAYARLHADMLSGKRPQRWLAVEAKSGLADNLKGFSTMLWLGLLTERALVIRFMYRQGMLSPKYEWAYDQPHINWTWDAEKYPMLSERSLKDNTHTQFIRLDPGSDKSGIPYRDTDKHALHIRYKDVRELYPDKDVLHVWTNLGMTTRLFDNPYHRQELFKMGLRPDTAFSCALNYLVSLKQEIKHAFAADAALFTDAAPLKIGIQVRAGDAVIDGQYSGTIDLLDGYDAFFDCATQIEQSRSRNEQQPVLWYLITDSMELRQKAAERFGSKLVTNLDTPVGHIVKQRKKTAQMADVFKVFQAAAGEMWLFSLMDYHIITRSSGFGRVPAMWSGRWHSLYSIDSKQKIGPEDGARHRSCQPMDYDSIRNTTIIMGGI